jgi:hypothetical protein
MPQRGAERAAAMRRKPRAGEKLRMEGTVFLTLLLLVLPAGCGPQPEAPVLMICIDGLDMSVMKPMLEGGGLPNLAKLVDRGVCGYFKTLNPAESPVVWTTIATGKTPGQHGITGFIDEKSGGPFTSNARKVRAFWNIADKEGLSCNLIGYWITWPAEPIRGCNLSQAASGRQAADQKMAKGTLYRGLDDASWPPDVTGRIWPAIEEARAPDRLKEKVVRPVFGVTDGLDPAGEVAGLIKSSFWSFEADAIYHAAACRLIGENPADINVVYYGGADVIAHRFWRYREPGRFSYEIDEKDIKAFGKSIEEYYRIVDGMVGELLGLFPGDVRVLVLSDHGMHADFLDGTSSDGKPTNLSAHHFDGPPGVLIAAGPGIRKGGGAHSLPGSAGVPAIGTVYDVTPTLLYLLDIPVGRDMKRGRVLKSLVTAAQLRSRPVARIDSHDRGFRPASESVTSEKVDEEYLEKFRSLGYFVGK